MSMLLQRYIGAVTHLGRCAKYVPPHADEQYGIDRAMADANTVMKANNVDIRFCKSADGGYAAFDADQVEDRNPYITPSPQPLPPERQPRKRRHGR